MASDEGSGTSLPRVWYYAPWELTNPLWPPVWRGGDEFGRRTIAFQPPLLGAVIVPYGKPNPELALPGDPVNNLFGI